MGSWRSDLFVSKVVFLGYVVSEEGISMDPSKVEAIRSWSSLSFITEKGVFEWFSSAQSAFKSLKQKLSSSPILALPNFDMLFELECDASGVGIGDVLVLVLLMLLMMPYQGDILYCQFWKLELLDSHFKELYEADLDFVSILNCSSAESKRDYVEKDGFLFKGSRLCILKDSIKELLVREAHGGGLADHFGINKTLEILNEHFNWPCMDKYVKVVINHCATCFQAKSAFHKGLYTPLLVPNQP
ncbi:uncharacterized protein [Rutidosis leptorrhynchoides]|uniref:uncharacterized protein n=1 Tax=Rutidosis leptorrhynchoides TaxID=125765 RepID=UPI003A9A2084